MAVVAFEVEKAIDVVLRASVDWRCLLAQTAVLEHAVERDVAAGWNSFRV